MSVFSTPLRDTAILLTGPTASGKSALALSVAAHVESTGRRCVIINADSMQVYDAIPIVTAQPDVMTRERIPHYLYGHVSAHEHYSVGRWRADLLAVLETLSEEVVPIIVGGTGLYFRSLTRGLASIPDVPQAVRARVKTQIDTAGLERAHEDLMRVDPISAVQIHPHDRQRIARAFEVHAASGRPLSDWQKAESESDGESISTSVARNLQLLVLAPPRDWLYARIDMRVEQMVDAGALNEIEALRIRDAISKKCPIMKAHGVASFGLHLDGVLSRDEAIARVQKETRNYAKRQMTWARHQFFDWNFITFTDINEKLNYNYKKIISHLLQKILDNDFLKL